jgi:hypothetical protein
VAFVGLAVPAGTTFGIAGGVVVFVVLAAAQGRWVR